MSLDQNTHLLLRHGEISTPKLSPWGSNYTFLVEVANGSRQCKAIYKPRDGEAPLWDFPSGTLYKRELAAYLLSQILGWDFIPFTLIRDGPYGIGSVQLYVEHDPAIHYFTLKDSHADALRVISCFDLVANNTDRKAGHCIQGSEGKIWGIDHGLTFHSDTKIRTVIWDFAGEPIPEHLANVLPGLLEQLEHPTGQVEELVQLLHPGEADALKDRIEWVLEAREYPGAAVRRRHRHRD